MCLAKHQTSIMNRHGYVLLLFVLLSAYLSTCHQQSLVKALVPKSPSLEQDFGEEQSSSDYTIDDSVKSTAVSQNHASHSKQLVVLSRSIFRKPIRFGRKRRLSQTSASTTAAMLVLSTVYRFEKKLDISQQQVAECNEKLDAVNAFAECSSLVALNWNCINNAPLDSGNPHLHHPHNYHRLVMSCGNDRQGPLFCCPVWALLRCMLHQVKLHCKDHRSSEAVEYDNSFNQQYQAIAFQRQIDELQRSRCAQFPFASTQCNAVLAFIRDPFALESDAIQSGMYQYFFPNANASQLAYLRSYKSAAASSRSTLNTIIPISCMILLASLSCSSAFTDCLFG